MEDRSRASCESKSEGEVDESLLRQSLVHRQRRITWPVTAILHLASVAVGIVIGSLMAQAYSTGKEDPRKFWRPSEFEPVKEQLSGTWGDVLYDAQLVYNSSGTLIRVPSNPDYVGEPTAELEEAWKNLLPAVTVWVTPEEAEHLGGGLVQDPKYGLYLGQLSATHELHCVNMLRQYTKLEHYPELAGDPRLDVHIEHCLDRLRLSIMCAGDMTVEPIKYLEDGVTKSPTWPSVHTCRDYDDIVEWTLTRDAAHPERMYMNAERLRTQGV